MREEIQSDHEKLAVVAGTIPINWYLNTWKYFVVVIKKHIDTKLKYDWFLSQISEFSSSQGFWNVKAVSEARVITWTDGEDEATEAWMDKNQMKTNCLF